MRSTTCLVAATILAAGWTSAHAEEEEAPDKDSKEPLSFAGRVFVRAVAQSIESELWEGELLLDSARLAVNYDWKQKARVKVSIEAAGGVEVKDAFIELAVAKHLTVQAGRFKLPLSALEQASAWTLPTIDRGAVADVLGDGVTLTGRRDGIQATWAKGERGPRVMVALSQSLSTDGLDPARAISDGAGVAATVRAEQDFCPDIRVGLFASNREVIDGSTARRYWAGGADLEVDLAEVKRGLRLWADVIGGQSHLGAAAAGRERTTFVAAQAAAGWRLGGKKKNKKYVEPFALASYFNPSVDRKGDDIAEVAGGVAGGMWKRWRTQAQVSVVNARGLRPAGLGGALVDVNDAVTITVQLGAAF